MKYLAIILSLLAAVFTFGCDEFEDKYWTETTDNEVTSEEPGALPVINAIRLYKDGEEMIYHDGIIGEEIVLEVDLRDPDKDIVTLYADLYLYPDYNTIVKTISFDVSASEEENFTATFEDQPYTLGEPAGYYWIALYAVDSKGNESFEEHFSFKVRESLILLEN